MLSSRTLFPLVLLCAALTAAPVENEAPLEPTLSPYEDFVEHPARHLGETIRFAFSFESEVATWNPFLTRFGAADFECVYGWSDSSFPWLAEEYNSPTIRLFLPRNSRAERRLKDAKPYARFAVEGVVRELFAGQPWIEVTSVERLEAALNEGAVIHAERGMREMQEEHFSLAIENFERARLGILPRSTADELERVIAECHAGLDAAGTRRTKPAQINGQNPAE
jgi:hypothetical protein